MASPRREEGLYRGQASAFFADQVDNRRYTILADEELGQGCDGGKLENDGGKCYNMRAMNKLALELNRTLGAAAGFLSA